MLGFCEVGMSCGRKGELWEAGVMWEGMGVVGLMELWEVESCWR